MLENSYILTYDCSTQSYRRVFDLIGSSQIYPPSGWRSSRGAFFGFADSEKAKSR